MGRLSVLSLKQVVAAICLALSFFALSGCERIGISELPVTTGEEKKLQELLFITLERTVISDELLADKFRGPDLRIFTRPEDLEDEEELSTVKELEDQLHALDYEHNFAILVLEGYQSACRSKQAMVTQILRQGERIIVRAEFPGPPSEGELMLGAVCLPYHLVSVRKDGDWGREMTFVLEGVTDGVETTLIETKHFIP